MTQKLWYFVAAIIAASAAIFAISVIVAVSTILDLQKKDVLPERVGIGTYCVSAVLVMTYLLSSTWSHLRNYVSDLRLLLTSRRRDINEP